jgi:hypothetical protein
MPTGDQFVNVASAPPAAATTFPTRLCERRNAGVRGAPFLPQPGVEQQCRRAVNPLQ